ncbi:hypothetical protein GGF37_005900 [Kickxella alabastrina]|nr:hypothetical protein GGF37_005900 [Kickxella alabastrina]
MFRNVYQSGILTVFNSASTQPLQLWSSTVAKNYESSSIEIRDDDSDITGPVLLLQSADLQSTFISCPRRESDTLGLKLPFMSISLKNIDHLFSFEIETADNRGIVRRFRVGNYETKAHIGHDISRLPLRLEQGWNYLTFDINDMTARIYGTKHMETRRVTFNSSVCLRLVLFADRIVSEDQLPAELKLYGRFEECH